MSFNLKILETDVVVVGGGTAGCYSAMTLAKDKDINVVILDKANIKRSGCLAAGVNAINAYLNEGETPESYVEYVKKEAQGIIREDLVYSIGENLNRVTQNLEDIGLTILKDEGGKYAKRGKRSIKINGENIKVLLAKQVENKENIKVLNNVNATDYLFKDGEVIGVIGFSLRENEAYIIYSKSVICATGGASGIYKPNNPGFSKHKMWYSPFNTGAGYAMGIRAGAEMTTFEMRFIALRCKDTIAPTGTIAQGVKAEQVNANEEYYVKNYGRPTTINRLYSTVQQNKNGQGPCYLETKGIGKEIEEDLYKAYLNMAPAQTLKWIEEGFGPDTQNVEIEGTEPYIVGGHSASGYWIDERRETTIKGIFAAGDVAGGSPKKYVTGCLVEGEIAAISAKEYIKERNLIHLDKESLKEKISEYERFFNNEEGIYSVSQIEEAMQKVMDEYAGGISTGYEYNNSKLKIAQEKIDKLLGQAKLLKAHDNHELMLIYENVDRLYIAKVLIAHLKERKETRWKCYGQNSDYKDIDEKFFKYVNSVMEDGKVKIKHRDIIKIGEVYEHKS